MCASARWLVAALLSVAGLAPAHHGEAQENRVPDAQAEPPRWNFTLTPYFWTTGLEGRAGVGGFVSDVSLSVGDVLDQFDIAVMGLFEARRAPWAVRADVFFVNLGDDVETATIEQNQLVLQPELGRTIVSGSGGSIDLLVGARYWNLDVDITAGSNELTGGEEWIDATAGAAWRFQPARSWHLFVKGDLGGGGSQFTWQAYGGAGYDLGRCCALSALYRYLDVDYEQDVIYDVHLNGPALGVTLRF
jgi:hypothetical protein